MGTAPRADVWLLLTYAGSFGSHAFEDSDLPDPVKQHLTAVLERIPHARLQLIRPDLTQDESKIELFMVFGRELDPFYLRYQLASYRELVAFDFDAILNFDRGSAIHALREPLYLVCTNGRRDPCCAQFGLPVFQALHDSLGDRVRQSSHVGGHRFAANVLLFPYGLCYGRILENQVAELLGAVQDGRMLLDKLRGRACYSTNVQAAEALLRQEVGNDDLSAFRLRDEQQIAENHWSIEFEMPGTGETHRVSVEATSSAERDRVSCWSDKLAPATSYKLRSHAVIS